MEEKNIIEQQRIKMQTPNLFTHATKELSQDALICYMLEWADDKFKDSHSKSYKVGVRLLDGFFGKYEDIIKPRNYSIEIKKQFGDIDILCIVNKKYHIIIEDKTNTSHHDNQLDKYYNLISKDLNIDSENILCIYYKSGEEYNLSQLNGQTATGISWEYKLFSKDDILDVLNMELDNQILIDYQCHIANLAIESNYKKLDISDWTTNTWISFVRDLKLGGNLTHGRGANKGVYFQYTIIDNDKIGFYLRISFEKRKIQFKLENEGDEPTKELGLKYFELLDKYSKNIKIKKVKFSSSKQTMTIAETDAIFLIVDDNNLIDFAKTKDFIAQTIKIHNSIVENVNNQT